MADIKNLITHLKSPGGLAGFVRSIISGEKDLVGLDIGSHSVKAVWLQYEGKQFKLRAWGIAPLDPKAETSPEERKFQVAQTIKDLFAEKAITLKGTATSVSGNAVIVRYVKLPKLSPDELNLTLSVEAEPFIPFDIKEVNLGYHVLSDVTEEGQKKMETVLVAAKKEVVQDRIDIIMSADLKPLIIDVDAFAIETAYSQMSAGDGAGGILFLNIGHKVTNLSIIEKGITRVVRDIFMAGSTIDKAIQKALTIDQSKTDELKKTRSILITADEKEKAIQDDDRDALAFSKAVSGVARDLAGEIARSVDFYLSQGQDRVISRIYLSGGAANLRNLTHFLSGELKVPVDIYNPMDFVAGKGRDIPADALPALTIAVGLALRKMGDWQQK